MVVRSFPKVTRVESVAERGPYTADFISHHVQPTREATCTTPHANTGHVLACARRVLLTESNAVSSLDVGILAYTSPFARNPLGGHFVVAANALVPERKITTRIRDASVRLLNFGPT